MKKTVEKQVEAEVPGKPKKPPKTHSHKYQLSFEREFEWVRQLTVVTTSPV